MSQELTTFDYSRLPFQAAMDLRMSAERVRTHMKRTAEDIIAIGQELQAAKKTLDHGRFGVWLASEFEMSTETAQNFLQVAERYGGKNVNFTNIKPSALYLLAAPSTPEPVREAVASGEVAPTHAAIKKAVDEAKALLAQEYADERERAKVRIHELEIAYNETDAEAQKLRKAASKAKRDAAPAPAPIDEKLRDDLLAQEQRLREMAAERKTLQARVTQLEKEAAKAAATEARKGDTQRKEAQRFSANASKVFSAATDLAASKPDGWPEDSERDRSDAAAMIHRAIETLTALRDSLSVEAE